MIRFRKLNCVVVAMMFAGLFQSQSLKAQHSVPPSQGPMSRLTFVVGKFTEDGKFNLYSSKPLGSSIMKPRKFNLNVPYTEMVEREGKKVPVTKMRTEVRTALAITDEADVDLEIGQIKFRTVGGETVGADEVKRRINGQGAFVLLQPKESLDAFYKQLLQKQTLIVEVDPKLLKVTD